MKSSLLARYPNWLAAQLENGNFGAVAMVYSYPAEIEYDGKCYVVETPQDVVRVLATYHAIFSHFRLSPHDTKVKNKPKWTSKQFQVFVEQDYRAPDSDEKHIAQLEFFLEWRKLRPGIVKVVVHKLPYGQRIAAQRVLKELEIAGVSAEIYEVDAVAKSS